MKKLFTFIIVATIATTTTFAQDITNTLGTNGTFIINSTDGGILIPRMTMVERDAITALAEGLMIYQTDDTHGFYYYNGTTWVTATGAKAINDLSDAKSGNNSYYIGLNSGTNNIGTYNVAVGDISMENATSAQGNVAIGSGSLKGLSTGKFNVGIGFNTGTLTTTGSENILIGSGLSTTSPTASNELNIGEAIYGTDIKGGNPRIGIGHTNSAPTSTLDIGGSISKPIVVKSENYTATDSDYTLIFSYITGTGEVILTLPDAIKSKGRIYVIRTTEVTTSNDRLVIRAHTGNTIEGLNDIEIGYQGLGLNSLEEVHAVTIQCDGSNWWIISATINN